MTAVPKSLSLVKAEDLAGLGACLSRYWQLKRALAPGSEPELIQRILAALRPLCLGASLAGAGGGGFLAAILKAGGQRATGPLAPPQPPLLYKSRMRCCLLLVFLYPDT